MAKNMAKTSTKTKKKNGAMTLERFASAIQKDFQAIYKMIAEIMENMATKSDVWKVRQEMATRAELNEVRNDVRMITESMVSKADLERGFEPIKQDIREIKEAYIEDLRSRTGFIEKKLGIRPERRAA